MAPFIFMLHFHNIMKRKECIFTSPGAVTLTNHLTDVVVKDIIHKPVGDWFTR